VIDVSGSMAEEDWWPTRLGAAKAAALAFIDERALADSYSRIAIVGFSELAFPLLPLTSVRDAARLREAIESLEAMSSTNITGGLEVAEQFLYGIQPQGAYQEVILLTDGMHNVGAPPIAVAERLKRQGCVIYVRGIGGNPGSVDEALLRYVASEDSQGQPLYAFIGDKQRLGRDFGELARRITR
jgi:Ca-activated chloride channel family protein